MIDGDYADEDEDDDDIGVPTDNSLFERHRPGSEVRVAMMTARASIGLDLWSGRNPFAYRSGDAH